MTLFKQIGGIGMTIQELARWRYQMTKCGGMAEWTALGIPPPINTGTGKRISTYKSSKTVLIWMLFLHHG